MTVTSTTLTRAAAVAAATAGAIFVAVQIDHPPMELASLATIEWVVRSGAKVVMTALALFGLAGLYLRQYREVGLLGLIGWVLFSLGYLLMSAVEVIATTVLPRVAELQPGYAGDFLVAGFGGKPAGDIGTAQTLLSLSGAGFMLGGLLFGVALFRAGVLARWACALLAVSTGGTAALAVLPDSFNRPVAVPVGVALVGLGVSLWRNPAADVDGGVPAAAPVAVR